MNNFDDLAPQEGEDTFDMSNLPPNQTGLPFIVWISPSMGASHDVIVKVSAKPVVRCNSELVSVAIRPNVRVVAGQMNTHDLDLLQSWIELNRDVLIKYWEGDIESTSDAIVAIKALSASC